MKIHRNIRNVEQDLLIYRQVFEGAQTCRYLGTLINLKNVSEETESRVVAGNRFYQSLKQIITSRAKSKAVKIKIYKTLMKSVVVYASDTWPMTEMDMKMQKTWDRKMLRRIYRPVAEKTISRIRPNQELQELNKDLDIVADIQRIGWNRQYIQ